MNADDLRTLFDYNYWATARIMRVAQEVTSEQYTAPNTSSYGSLRATLVHTMRAEIIWRRRLQGEPQPTDLPVEDNFPTPQSLYKTWVADERQMRAYLVGLNNANIQEVIHYKTTKGVAFYNVVWHILTHVVNHGTQHRAEAAAMLTDFNHSPGDIDMILYYREKEAQ
jgi:uncharacterized damage-inducible protein DinB